MFCLEVLELTDFLNFRRPFYSRVWVELVPKNFELGEKKKGKDLLNCKYKITFQPDGCLEPR